jgi:Holliday junction resolvase
MASLVTSLSRRAHDDYVVAIGKAKFRALLHAQDQIDPIELERLLVNKPADYAANTNAVEPFIDVGDALVSNVNLLSRFLYAFKNIHLGSRRRFQIHAGFIFEEMVARDLRKMGFDVTEINRINRKEFDIVATFGDVIYNLQCKNNWIDFSKIESDRALFVRYNRSLANYYARALAKERSRESLLTERLGRSKIEHFVISRFPVITEDPQIICYNRLETLMDVTNPIS